VIDRLSRVPTSARWTIAVLIIVVALIAAIWPRGSGSSDDGLGAGSPAASAGPIPGATASVSADDLSAARDRAALAPCPTGTAPAPQNAVLKGVTAPCLGGPGTVDLGSATAGKPLLINFWAPWCLPCRKELPSIADFARVAGDRVQVLAVQAKEGSENPVLALGLLSEIDVHLPSVVDSRSTIAAALGAPRAYPVSILVRADGTVAKVLPTVFADTQAVTDSVNQYLGTSL